MVALRLGSVGARNTFRPVSCIVHESILANKKQKIKIFVFKINCLLTYLQKQTEFLLV